MVNLEELSSQEASYQPSADVKGMLQHVNLVCIVGGTGVGKNYLMKLSRLPIVGRVTSRPQRPDDDPNIYTFYTNEQLGSMIQRGELVQYAVDLGNSTIYGSMSDDYKTNEPTLADIWHWSVDMLKNKGFGSVRAISVITPREQWKHQLDMRFAARDEAYRIARLDEAIRSLQWTKERIERGDPDHMVIINDQHNTERSVQLLKDFAHGGIGTAPPNAISLIDELLAILTL